MSILKKVIFYYIHSPIGNECLIVNGNGDFVKTECDLQHIIPHLFNSMRQAKIRRELENLKGWKIARYPYKYGWWSE